MKLHWPFPLVADTYSSEAIILGYKVYGCDIKIIDVIHDVVTFILDLKYALLYRLVKGYKYHVVYTDLPPAYHCSDTRMLWACMKCLEEYVEAHGPQALAEHLPELRDVHPPQYDSTREALAIYSWWKYVRPKNLKKLDDLLSSPDYKVYHDLETQIDQEDQDYLHRLINIRQHLWV